ncbi:DUF1016 N-terminal domain-containing protein [Variovorax sp. WDL1]|uniref:DUF1016 N-terminal domain-containing protein n=1 Tax=Variovorax sp. WDL1 TaxID=207745 RepID=UPI003FCED7E0
MLGGDRAGYGEQIVVTLSRQLSAEHGGSFSEKNLRRMIQFAGRGGGRLVVADRCERSSRLLALHSGQFRLATTPNTFAASNEHSSPWTYRHHLMTITR